MDWGPAGNGATAEALSRPGTSKNRPSIEGSPGLNADDGDPSALYRGFGTLSSLNSVCFVSEVTLVPSPAVGLVSLWVVGLETSNARLWPYPYDLFH
jgi:hypothetical protein